MYSVSQNQHVLIIETKPIAQKKKKNLNIFCRDFELNTNN